MMLFSSLVNNSEIEDSKFKDELLSRIKDLKDLKDGKATTLTRDEIFSDI